MGEPKQKSSEPTQEELDQEATDLTEMEAKLAREEALAIEEGKFFAAALDRAATALLTVAILTPITGYAFKLRTFRMLSGLEIAFLFIACGLVILALHLSGRTALRKGYER